MQPLVVDPTIDTATVERIAAARPDLPIVHPDDETGVIGAFDGTDGPVSFVSRNSQWQDDYLAGLDAGDWVVTKTTGYENFPEAAFRDRGVAFSNLPGLTRHPIADHVFGLILSVTRRLGIYHDQQQARNWERQPAGMTDLVGEICCIVGIGRIGEKVAERGQGFGLEIRGVKRDVDAYDGVADAVYGADQLQEALDGASIVVIALPLTDETHGLIGAEELAACDDDAIVVNIARGQILETDALVAALDADELWAACLDVVDNRPPADDWPLWGRDDVVVTPHVAGQSDKTPGRLVDELLAEYDRWMAGKSFRHEVVSLPDG